MQVNAFYHPPTGTASYLVSNDEGQAAIIDSVLDFSMSAGKVSFEFVQQQLDYLNTHQLTLRYIIETHAHADHMSAAEYLRQQTGAQTVIGEGIVAVQARFEAKFNHVQRGSGPHSGFDRLLKDGDVLEFGECPIRAIHTPGHTDDSMSFVIGDNVFVGDTLFMPDGGTARCDFPGGSAKVLWQSIGKIHALPEHTRIWVCHDYQPNGRELALSTTVGESKRNNIHVGDGKSEQDFVSLREARDATLAVPNLLYPSLQVNLWGGKLPKHEANGLAYIKVPITLASPQGDAR